MFSYYKSTSTVYGLYMTNACTLHSILQKYPIMTFQIPKVHTYFDNYIVKLTIK